MSLWLLTIASLFIQELTATNMILLAAHQYGLGPWIIHGIWFSATIIDITVGFYIGKWIKKRFAESRIDRLARHGASIISQYIGKSGLLFSLILLGFISVPYLNGFVSAWLPGITYLETLTYTLIGDFLWYFFVWTTVLGISAIAPDFKTALIAIICVCVLISVIGNFIKRKNILSDRD